MNWLEANTKSMQQRAEEPVLKRCAGSWDGAAHFIAGGYSAGTR